MLKKQRQNMGTRWFPVNDKAKVLVVDDQYVARSFFEIHVQMAKKYDLVASR